MGDACWLCPENDVQHINVAELGAVLKGVNVALQWKAIELHLFTDSVCDHGWVFDTVSGKARIHTDLERDAHSK